MRYLSLWRRFAVMGLARMLEYRVNFAVGVASGLGGLVLAVLTFLIIYQFTDDVAGWSQAQALLLVGVYKVAEGLIGLQVAPNMQAIPGYIRTGDLDFILLSPVPSRFLVSVRTLALPAAFDVLSGLVVVVYAGNGAHVHWSVVGVAEASVFLLCGLLLLYSVWFLTVTLAFWLVQVQTLDTLFASLFETARYPVSFFKGLVRGLLTFAFPVAFATTFPTQALLGTSDPALLLVGTLLAALALAGTQRCWDCAVRRYSSASS